MNRLLQPEIESMAAVQGLRIAARVIPVDGVGGDYFDVINYADGTCLIALGDVAGHGIEAGIVAMLLKNHVREIFTTPELDLKVGLSILNGVLFENLKNQMKDQTNMTFGLVRHKFGKIEICGLHEDILWIKRNRHQKEIISTADLGVYLGMMEDISAYLHVLMLDLEHGDYLVLHTDGLTESRNTQNEFFQFHLLTGMVEKHNHLPVEGILDAVIDDFFAWKGNTLVDDDLSLIFIEKIEND